MTINFHTGLPDSIYERPAMKPAQIEKIMSLVDEYLYAPLKQKREAIEAALRDAPQAEPNDSKDAARYRYLVVMETKAAPDTVAHYIRNPAHLDRVIEVMGQKP